MHVWSGHILEEFEGEKGQNVSSLCAGILDGLLNQLSDGLDIHCLSDNVSKCVGPNTCKTLKMTLHSQINPIHLLKTIDNHWVAVYCFL